VGAGEGDGLRGLHVAECITGYQAHYNSLMPSRPTPERARFWRDAALGDVDLLTAHYVTHSFAPHFHEGYAIGVIEQGAETFSYRGATEVAPAGHVVIVNPGEIHTGSAVSESGWAYRMLYPSVGLLSDIAREINGRPTGAPFFSQAVLHDPAIAAGLARAHRAIETAPQALDRESALLITLADLIRRHADARIRPAPFRDAPHIVARAREVLAADLAQDLSLADVARVAEVSRYHLIRLFRRHIGLAPHAYRTQLRVQRARALLAEGWAIADAAAAVGFVDQSHLNRHFKRVYGVTPGAVRPDRAASRQGNFVQDDPGHML